MMDVEFYRGSRSEAKSESSSGRYFDHGRTKTFTEAENRNGYSYITGHGHTISANREVGRKPDVSSHNKSYDTSKDSTSVKSFDSTGKQKSFRRLITRFADKTSMVGVPYISNAKFWWARLIWCIMLFVAICAMSLHLWYLIDQFTDWPVQTKISLGFETLKFPQVTICNTNVMHRSRLYKYDSADTLKDLLEGLKPENLVPDQYDPNYDPYAPPPPPDDKQPGSGSPTDQDKDGNQPGGESPPSDKGQGSPTNEPPKQNGRRRKRFVERYKNFNKTRYDGNNRPNLRDVKPQEDDDYDGKVDAQTEIEDLFTGMYMDINKAERARLGHNITDMVISCTFNGRECSANMFSLHQTSEYGNCWSIRSDKFNVKNPGPSGGLSFVLNLESTEYLDGITTGFGARLQIHEQHTYPSPADEGLYIPASMETDVGLRMVSITRLGGLYGDCDDGIELKKSTKYKYTRSACQTFCQIAKIIEKCNCFDEKSEEFAGKKDSQLKPCRSARELLCMVKVQKWTQAKMPCSCANPCNEVQYTKSVSQRQWPSDDYSMVLLQEICERDPDVCSTLRKYIDYPEKLRNNFLKLNVYYEDLNFENMTEEPEIEVQQFMSDVGVQLVCGSAYLF